MGSVATKKSCHCREACPREGGEREAISPEDFCKPLDACLHRHSYIMVL